MPGKMRTTGLFDNHQVNSASAGNHSILALSNDCQFAAALLAQQICGTFDSGANLLPTQESDT